MVTTRAWSPLCTNVDLSGRPKTQSRNKSTFVDGLSPLSARGDRERGAAGRSGSPLLAEYQRIAVGRDVDRNRVAVVGFAGQQHLRELIADGLLHQSPQWARAIDRVEPALGQPALGRQ